MGLFQKQLKRMEELDEQLVSGKGNVELIQARLAVSCQAEKWAKLAIAGYALEARYGKRTLKKLVQMNLLGDGEAIDIDADLETEKIKCPEKDYKLITRAECLDYSGSHNKECNGCDHKVITQNLLLGPSK